jgi:hypothetical protein
MILEALEEYPVCYDHITIDEAQDIINSDTFDIFKSEMKNGLTRGNGLIHG